MVDVLSARTRTAAESAALNDADGFLGLYDGIRYALQQLRAQLTAFSGGRLPAGGSSPSLAATPPATGGGICARVTLRIEQEAVITRDAFDATLQSINTSDAPLRNVAVDLAVETRQGEVATSLFGIRPPALTGLSDVSGNGMVSPNETAQASWIIIPTSDAANRRSPRPQHQRHRGARR
jgi:hypothetical protein